MVRLGAGGLDGRALTPEAMQTALQVLSKFNRLAESHSVDQIVAVATSAVREAENGGEFLKTVASQTGIRPRVISGTEEARLIHMAAAYGVGAQGETLVVIDIGGGSVEITRGAGTAMDTGRSFKLGVIRLTERYVKSDPISPREERKLVRHIESDVGEYPGSHHPRGLRSCGRHVGNDSESWGTRRRAERSRHVWFAAESPDRRQATASRTTGDDLDQSREARPRARPGAAPRRSVAGRRRPARHVAATARRRRNYALRSVATRGRRPRLRRPASQADRAGRSVS